MKFNSIKKTRIFVISLLSVWLLQPVYAASLNIPDTPLTVTTFVPPNVMFVLDDSGSMYNIVWDTPYKPSTTYTDWSSSWSATSGNVSLSSVSKGSCASGYKEGKNGGNVRCLKLPDPAAGSTRYAGNYLNYLFDTYGVNGGNGSKTDITAIIPNDYRMNVARNVTNNVINGSGSMNFCLQSFDYQEAGTIDVKCTITKNTVTTAVSNLTPNSWTPLAETYYEVTRYFRGMKSSVNNNIQYTSPISKRCQKNFAIVVTDGYPTYDTSFPNNDPDDVANISRSLPNWDNLAPATSVADFNNNSIPANSDGFQPTNDQSNEGYSLYLDDVAKFALDVDMRTGVIAGENFDAADYPLQNLVTYTVGFALNNQMLQDAATNGTGTYYQANDTAGLTTALSSALSDIVGRTSASAAVAASTGFINTSSGIYQGRYNSSDWTGQMLFFKLNTTTGKIDFSGSGPNGSQWDAATKIPSESTRNVYSYNGSKGVPFQWATTTSANTLTSTQLTDIGSHKVLDYIRGDQSCEVSSAAACTIGDKVKNLRTRSSRLGTVVNSSPLFLGPPSSIYPEKWDPDAKGVTPPENCVNCEYSKFRENTTNKARKDMLFFNANDGMLHAIDAITGTELFSYVPAAVIPKLKNLSLSSYKHEFSVDGSPNVIDAFYNAKWHTVLVSGLNKGGQGIFALDVTDPSKFTASGADTVSMWEFTDKDDADLGYSYARPVIVRMYNGKWAAIFGNGYNNTTADGNASTTGRAYLYIVFLDAGLDGSWSSSDYVKIDTGYGSTTSPNGIGTVSAIDINDDRIIDYIYGGDLNGNMWKFDVTNKLSNKWDVAIKSGSTKIPLIVARDGPASSDNRQAITTRPVVSRGANGGFMVHFGTGRYLDDSDSSSSTMTSGTPSVPTTNPELKTKVEHFYGVLDKDDGSYYTDFSGFLKQTVVKAQVETFTDTTTGGGTGTKDVRLTTELGTNINQNWYFVLPTTGERQISKAIKRGNNIIFTSIIPSAQSCDYGGDSWLMELDSRDGSRPNKSVFDLSGEGKINDYDKSKDGYVSGVKQAGISSNPTIITDNTVEHKYISNSSGNINVVDESKSEGSDQRHSWRQIR